MTYSEQLAGRVRGQVSGEKDVLERVAFGILEISAAGNMACRVRGDSLVVRVGPDLHHDALTREHTSEYTEGGIAKKGWIEVAPRGLADDESLHLWVRLGLMHARSLPPRPAALKAAKKAARKRAKKASARQSVKKASARQSVKKASAKKSVKKASAKKSARKAAAKNTAKKSAKKRAKKPAKKPVRTAGAMKATSKATTRSAKRSRKGPRRGA